MTLDERFVTINDLKQGDKFIYKDEQFMILPEHCECFGEKANAVNLRTGTMMYFNPNDWIDLVTMIVEEKGN